MLYSTCRCKCVHTDRSRQFHAVGHRSWLVQAVRKQAGLGHRGQVVLQAVQGQAVHGQVVHQSQLVQADLGGDLGLHIVLHCD